MLTTEDWDTCLSDPTWRKSLAAELGSKNAQSYGAYGDAIQALYEQAYPNGKPSDWLMGVRGVWNEFITKHLKVNPPNYGVRPCAGGKTILEIAHLGSTHT
jgi:hypothetical protein